MVLLLRPISPLISIGPSDKEIERENNASGSKE